MSSPGVSVQVTLSPQLEAMLRRPAQFVAGPVSRYLRKSALAVQGRAISTAPVDESQVKNSHEIKIDSGKGTIPRWAQVLNTSQHATIVHGTARDNYTWGRRPGAKAPPAAALQGWASRHGFSNDRGALFLLARAIGRDGIKAKPWLKQALEHETPRIQGSYLTQLAHDLQQSWNRGHG